MLSNKVSQCSQINFVDQDNVISDDKNLSKEFCNFFDTAAKNSDIKGSQVSNANKDPDAIAVALNKYADHLGILKIKE